jgi:hypothetical protein
MVHNFPGLRAGRQAGRQYYPADPSFSQSCEIGHCETTEKNHAGGGGSWRGAAWRGVHTGEYTPCLLGDGPQFSACVVCPPRGVVRRQSCPRMYRGMAGSKRGALRASCRQCRRRGSRNQGYAGAPRVCGSAPDFSHTFLAVLRAQACATWPRARRSGAPARRRMPARVVRRLTRPAGKPFVAKRTSAQGRGVGAGQQPAHACVLCIDATRHP